MPSSPPRHIASSLRIMRATYSRLRWKAPENFPSILIKSPRASPRSAKRHPSELNFHDPRSDQAGGILAERERKRERESYKYIIIIINKIVERTIHAQACNYNCEGL